jgi:rare lipoprotein A
LQSPPKVAVSLQPISEVSRTLWKIAQKRSDMKIFKFIMIMIFCITQVAMQVILAATAQEGEASYYADSLNGQQTASGELYDKGALSAAHRSLPFGTKVKVTYLKSGLSVVVIINDRGPNANDRIIDLSGAAAKRIGLIDAGHGRVRLEVIEP